MDMLSICRICLVEDVTMYTVVNSKLRDLYEKLTAMPFQMANSRPLQVCYICRARLQSCYRLQLSCLRSENLLAKMVASNQLESKWLLSANTLGIVHPLVQLSCVPVTEEVHHDDQDHHVVKPINMADVHIKEEHLEDTEELYPAPVDIVKVEDVDVEEHDVLTYSHHMTHETSNMDLDSKQEVSIQNTGLALRNVDRITQNDLNACDMFSIESSDNELLKPFKGTNTEELPPVPADIVKVENVDVEDQHMTHETYNWEIDSKHEVSIQNMGPALRNVDQITHNDLKACDMLSIESSNNELLKPFKETSASLDKNTKLAEEFVNIQSALTSQHKVEATYENHIKCKSKIQTGDKHVKMKKNAIIVGVAAAGKPFKCEICEKSFDRTLHLERHIRVHTGEKPYECDKCKKCFNQKQHLVQHIRVHTGEKPFKCDICGKCFNQPQILERHIRVHTGEKPYECDICKKCFNQKQHLVLHIRVHTGEKPFKCDICGKSFSRPQILEQHIRVHTGEKPFKCDICKKCYIRRSHLVRHAHTHTDEKPYKCNICEKRFNFKQNLVKHNRLHTGQKSYNCNICDKSFNQKHNLVEHINVHTGERPYKCDLCEKCFKRQQDLTLHSRMHTGENLYKCDVCAKCFYQKQHLILHNRKHTGEKRYKCDVCDKTFNLNQNLKVHIRTHTGEKPYKCDVCAKGFSQKQLLILHNYKHTGEKPYKCNACYRAFTTKQKLKKHVGRQACELSYKCDKCGKHYSLKQNFTRHVRMQHKGDEASPLLQSHGSDVIDVPPVRRPLKCYSRKK